MGRIKKFRYLTLLLVLVLSFTSIAPNITYCSNSEYSGDDSSSETNYKDCLVTATSDGGGNQGPTTPTIPDAPDPGAGVYDKQIVTDSALPDDFTWEDNKNTAIYAVDVTNDEKAAVEAGKTLTAKVTVDAADYSSIKNTNEDVQRAENNLAQDNDPSDIHVVAMDIKVNKVLSNDAEGSDVVSSTPVSELKTGITLSFPAPTLGANKQFKEYLMLRIHGGVTESITLTYNSTTNTFSFSSDKFSDYVFFYTVADKTYTISLDQDGSIGDGHSADGYPAKSDPSKTEYDVGDTITIVDKPEPGYEFDGWVVDPSDSVDLGTTVYNDNGTVQVDVTIKELDDGSTVQIGANHKAIDYVLPVVSLGTGGLEYVLRQGSATAAHVGDTIIYEAVPMDGYEFDKWVVTGDLTLTTDQKTSNPLEFIMPASDNFTLTATFKELPKYNVTVTVNDNAFGTVSPATVDPQLEDSTLAFTASPKAGYKFKNWEVTGVNITASEAKNATLTIKVGTSDITIKAIFEVLPADTYAITTEASINCSASSSPVGSTTAGTSVTVTGSAPEGYKFIGWTSDDITIADADKLNNPYTFTMPAKNVSIKANYVKEYTITVTSSDENKGTVSASATKGVTNDTVTLTAVAKPGYQFSSWTITGTTGAVTTTPSTTITVKNSNITAKANFTTMTSFTVTVNKEGAGSATASVSNTEAGATVTLTAVPAEGYDFNKWVAVTSGVTINNPTNAKATFVMPNKNVTVKAVFTTTLYDITMIDDGNGTASCALNSTAAGTKVTITASPKNGYKFSKWTVVKGNVTLVNAGAASTTFTMPKEDVSIKANFVEIDNPDDPDDPSNKKYTLTVQNDGHGSASASASSAKEGEYVTISATANDGYVFKKWEGNNNVYFLDNTKASTKIRMPGNNCSVKAIFEKKDSGSSDTPGSPSTPTSPSTPKTDDSLYSQIFMDWNGVVIKTSTHKLGTAVTEPSKPADFVMDGYIYKFVRWWSDSNAIFDGICHGNQKYTAQYYKAEKSSDSKGTTTGKTDTTKPTVSPTDNKDNKDTKDDDKKPNNGDPYDTGIPVKEKDRSDYTEEQLQNLENNTINEEDLTDDQKEKVEEMIRDNEEKDAIDNDPNTRGDGSIVEDVAEKKNKNAGKIILISLLILLLLAGGGFAYWWFILRKKDEDDEDEGEDEDDDDDVNSDLDDDTTSDDSDDSE